MSTKPIVVYGAGGLARETEWVIDRINQVRPTWSFEGYVVTDLASLGEYDSQEQVAGDEGWLLARRGLSVAIGIGTPGARVGIGARLSQHLTDDLLPALVDPSVIQDERSCVTEPGAILTAGTILTVNIRVKRFAFVNLDCTIGHEAIIGVGSVLNPSVNVSGGVNIGEGVLVGTGAQILQYARIGDGATVGAGAVVVKDVAPGQTVVGVPARPRG